MTDHDEVLGSKSETILGLSNDIETNDTSIMDSSIDESEPEG